MRSQRCACAWNWPNGMTRLLRDEHGCRDGVAWRVVGSGGARDEAGAAGECRSPMHLPLKGTSHHANVMNPLRAVSHAGGEICPLQPLVLNDWRLSQSLKGYGRGVINAPSRRQHYGRMATEAAPLMSFRMAAARETLAFGSHVVLDWERTMSREESLHLIVPWKARAVH